MVASESNSGAAPVHVLQPKKKRRVAPEPVQQQAPAVSPVPHTSAAAGAGAVAMSLGDLVSPPLCPAPGKTGGGSPEAAAAAAASDLPIKTATMPVVVEVQGVAGMTLQGASATSAINLDEAMAPPSMGLPGGMAGVAGVTAPKKEKKRIKPVAVETNGGSVHH